MATDVHSPSWVNTNHPAPPQRPPASEVGALGWLRANLFSDMGNSILTVVTLIVLYYIVTSLVQWAIGAYWAPIWANRKIFAVGLYPTAVSYTHLDVYKRQDMDGATVCVQSGTTTELNLADVFRAGGLEFTPVVFEDNDKTLAAYDEGRCDGYTTDKSGLVSSLSKLNNPADHMILEDTMSKWQLAGAVYQGWLLDTARCV